MTCLKMRVSSLTNCFFGIALMLFVVPAWDNLIRLNFTPGCPITLSSSEKCYRSSLASDPELQLAVFTSASTFPDHKEVTPILHVQDFDYSHPYFKESTVNIKGNKTLYVHIVLASMDIEQDLKYFNWLRSSYKHLITAYTSQLTGLSPHRNARYNLLRGQESKSTIQLGELVPHYVSKIYMVGLTGNVDLSFMEISKEVRNLFLVNYDSDMHFLPIITKEISNIKTEDLFEITENTREVKFEFYWNPIKLGQLRMMLQPNMLPNSMPIFSELNKLLVFNGSYPVGFYYLTLWLLSVYRIPDLADFFLSRKDKKVRRRAEVDATPFNTIMLIVFFLYFLDVPIYIVAVYYGYCLILRIRDRKSNRRIQSSKKCEIKRMEKANMRFLIYFLMIPLCLSEAAFSLNFHTHTGWYSWSLEFFAINIYALELATNIRNLYVNYKVKTVEPQPWHKVVSNLLRRSLIVVFAFILKMPRIFTLFCICDTFITMFAALQRYVFYCSDESRYNSVTNVDDDCCIDSEKNVDCAELPQK